MVAARMLSLVLVAAVAAFHSAVAQTVSEDYLNSYQWMATYKNTGQTCVTTWQQIQAIYYSGDNAACGDLVFKALNTIVPSQCPGGAPPNGDRPGGELWNCMTGNGANTALKDAWVNFVRNCEIFYVAYRFPGEAESGFKSKDNSCLRKFVDTDAFRSYLNARPGNDNGSAETIVSRALPVMFAIICSVVLALLF